MPFSPPNFVEVDQTIDLYSAPNKNAHLVTTAYIGETLVPLNKSGKNWLEVVDSTTGMRGWINSHDVYIISEKLAKEKRDQ